MEGQFVDNSMNQLFSFFDEHFVFDTLKIYGGFVLKFWWLWLPLFLFFVFFQSWMYYIRRKFRMETPYVLLEIKPPKEIEQSPKIAEAIFAGVYGISGTVTTKAEKYLKGATQHYFSFEIVGIGGQIKFLVRVPAIHRNLIEAKIYAEYPQAEISQVEDYVYNLPSGVLDRDWDIWGTFLQLTKENPYPIRTYQEFVDILPKQPFIDPISNLMEVMTKLRPGEQIWIQIFTRPTPDSWIEEGKKIVGKLIGRTETKKKGVFAEELSGWSAAFGAVKEEIATGKTAPSVSVKEEKPAHPSLMQFLSPGEKEVVDAIERKMAKKAFESKIHVLYLGKKDVFFKPTISSIFGFLNQFATLNLNGFKPNARYTTKAYYVLPARRLAFKKRILLKLCQQRTFWEKGFILNIEELASLWHFPATIVAAPVAPAVEAKKGAPPPELPTA
jgi:hypothetical protein